MRSVCDFLSGVGAQARKLQERGFGGLVRPRGSSRLAEETATRVGDRPNSRRADRDLATQRVVKIGGTSPRLVWVIGRKAHEQSKICDFLGIGDAYKQAQKLVARGFGDLTDQRSVKIRRNEPATRVGDWPAPRAEQNRKKKSIRPMNRHHPRTWEEQHSTRLARACDQRRAQAQTAPAQGGIPGAKRSGRHRRAVQPA